MLINFRFRVTLNVLRYDTCITYTYCIIHTYVYTQLHAHDTRDVSVWLFCVYVRDKQVSLYVMGVRHVHVNKIHIVTSH